MMSKKHIPLWSIFALLLAPIPAFSSSYFEVGTGVGSMTHADSYFNTPGMSTSSGFLGTFNWYLPVTSEKRFTHLELGIQNRLYLLSATNPSRSPSAATTSLAARLEFWRVYVGGGYSPLQFQNVDGVSKLKSTSGHTSTFLEGGLIWRVVPEFQITLNYSVETASNTVAGGTSTGSGYGLTFRFPINPKDNSSKSEVDFDGGRYPFGFMK